MAEKPKSINHGVLSRVEHATTHDDDVKLVEEVAEEVLEIARQECGLGCAMELDFAYGINRLGMTAVYICENSGGRCDKALASTVQVLGVRRTLALPSRI